MATSRQSEYLALIEHIARLQRRKLALEREQAKNLDRTRSIHARLVLEIGTSKDDKGKLIYSNEQLRAAALTLKLDEHTEFRDLREKRQALSNEIAEIAIELNKLVDQKYMLMLELGISLSSENEKYPDVPST